jgi:predicted nucleic acid-binding protein
VIVVDTNVWSELNKPAPDPHVCNFLIQHDERLWLSVVVIAEIRRGIEMPKAAFRRPSLLVWLAELEHSYSARILDFDADMAHVFGALFARRQGEATLLDLQIAAQGLARDMTIATRNVKDFAWTGVRLMNPWEG